MTAESVETVMIFNGALMFISLCILMGLSFYWSRKERKEKEAEIEHIRKMLRIH